LTARANSRTLPSSTTTRNGFPRLPSIDVSMAAETTVAQAGGRNEPSMIDAISLGYFVWK